MPIGNLTSQIFANIYLNELDRFIKHGLRIKNYLRYGDDFIIVERDKQQLVSLREKVSSFLNEKLKLQLNPDLIRKAKQGLKFLGVVMYPKGRKLSHRNQNRLKRKLNPRNVSSYYGLVTKHTNKKSIKEFHWVVSENLIFFEKF